MEESLEIKLALSTCFAASASKYPADGEFFMKTLSYRSLLYWLTLAVAVGIIFIGVRFLFAPDTVARAFGIPLRTLRTWPSFSSKEFAT
jgi:hypothetical protein